MIPAWRSAATIARAVKSALAEPQAAEVFVADNGSEDGGATIEAARAADDGTGRLKVVGLPPGGGPGRARNAAIDRSASPWICILDSDDYFEPGRLATLLSYASDGHDLIADDLLQVMDGADRSTAKPLWFTDQPAVIDISLLDFINANIPHPSRYRRELGFLKPMMSSDFLRRNGLRYTDEMFLGEDYDLYVRALAAGGRLRLIPAAGYVSVMRSNSLSAHHSRADLVAFEAADDRLLDLATLSTAEKLAARNHKFSTYKRIAWIDFMDRLKAGQIGKACAVVAKDPRVTPYIAAGLFKAVSSRVARGGKRRPD